MSVGVHVANIVWPVGAASFFNSFFSTIGARLEPDGWGRHFPIVMSDLYQGEVSGGERAAAARKELDTIRAELSTLPPSAVVWDIHDRAAQPPWGVHIADTVTDLGNYFWTSDGRDLFEVLGEALDFSASSGTPLRVA